MLFKALQSITDYRLQNITMFRQSILSLKDLTLKFGYNSSDDKFSIWRGILSLADELDFLSGDELAEEQKKFQENIILFIDNDLLLSLQTKMQGLDSSAQNISQLSELDVVNTQLSLQLEYVCTILNLFKKSGVIYSSEELFTAMTNTTSVENKFRILNTLVYLLNDDEIRQAARFELPKFLTMEENIQQKLYTWEEAVTLFLVLAIVVKEFSHLSEFKQYFVVKNYFYHSLVLGVPIVKVVESALSETRNILSYVDKNLILLNAFVKNQEHILTGKNLETQAGLADLLNKYIGQNLSEPESETNVTKFLEEYYIDAKDKNLYVNWLKSFFSTYFHLAQANLIDNNTGGQLNEKEIAENELIRLCTFFALGQIGFDEIIQYYQQQNEINVPLTRFITKLRELADLKDQSVADDLLVLTAALHENGILLDNNELIEFHESDNKFHWNEDYLK